MILLFTDFGSADLYTGQVKAVLAQHAPGVPVIDLLNDAPNFNVRASAHLLAALAPAAQKPGNLNSSQGADQLSAQTTQSSASHASNHQDI